MGLLHFTIVVLLAGTGALAAFAVGVLGHVSVSPRRIPAGGHDKITVRVPTERDSPTVSVRVEVPSALHVKSFQVKDGWKRDVERNATGEVVAVTWAGGSVPKDEFEEFYINVLAPSEETQLVWKAFQTHADGVVTVFGGNEPGAERAPTNKVVHDA